jgi:hypothetical protein
VATWADVLADHSYCGRDAGIGSFIPSDARGACGGYNVRLLTPNMDVTEVSYYDASTGALVAIALQGDVPQPGCVAGPAAFTSPCSFLAGTTAHCSGPDASVDR